MALKYGEKIVINEKEYTITSFLDTFEWYEIGHMAHIASVEDLLSDKEKVILYNYYYLPLRSVSRGERDHYFFEDWQHDQFNQIFSKFIKSYTLGYHCGKLGCNECHKFNLFKIVLESESENLDGVIDNYVKQKKKLELDLKLYDWQKECINVWEKTGEGIIKVVTGAGKTILALEAISRLYNKSDYLKVFIVVPTIPLLHQWRESILMKLGVDEDDIGLFYGDEWGDYKDDRIQLYVVNSARELLPDYNNELKDLGFETFLIADECHRYGSEKNSLIFDSDYDLKMGLSAVPERESDFAFDEVLVPNLGEIIFEYSYADALADGIIPEFTLINYEISFEDDELNEYNALSESIKKMRNKVNNKYPNLEYNYGTDYFKYLNNLERKNNDDDIKHLKGLFQKRRILVHNARIRYRALYDIIKEIFNDLDNPRVIVFHELIECAKKVYDDLSENYNVGLYHSEMPKSKKTQTLYDYKHGFTNILVTCKALDEGLDVPNTNVGIIVSATKTRRQRIQRIGRILRKADGKDHSFIYTLFIPGIDDAVFNDEEIQNIEGIASVVHRSWNEQENDSIFPIENVKCPTCSNEGAYWILRQLDKSDKPDTKFYTCTNCGYKWREGES